MMRHTLFRLALFWLGWPLALAACAGGPTPTPSPPPPPALAATPTRLPGTPTPSVRVSAAATANVTAATLRTAPELSFLAPGEPLPEGPVTVRGLYGQNGAGDRSVTACLYDGATLRCQRYPVGLPVLPRALVEVDLQIEAGQVRLIAWRPAVDDLSLSREAAQAALARVADQVEALDWSAVARADFAQSTAPFRWPAADVAAAAPELFGYDMATGRVLWRVQGPNLPAQRELVTRYPALYVFSPLEGQGPVDVVATIEGFVTE
ncbi:MAG: hypothetical protein RMN53_00685 [Anaerolineae bacterium]|nr:hypothetical protein [Anaerolineae bacterium]